MWGGRGKNYGIPPISENFFGGSAGFPAPINFSNLLLDPDHFSWGSKPPKISAWVHTYWTSSRNSGGVHLFGPYFRKNQHFISPDSGKVQKSPEQTENGPFPLFRKSPENSGKVQRARVILALFVERSCFDLQCFPIHSVLHWFPKWPHKLREFHEFLGCRAIPKPR